MPITLNARSIIFLTLTLTLSITPSIVLPESAHAADCIASACISVYTQNGQIIIEGRKDASPAVVRVWPKRTRAASPTPALIRKVTRSPRVISHTHPRTVPRVVKKTLASVSLNDKLIKLLPDGLISKQPDSGAVVGVDVIFWSALPAVFSTRVSVVGEVIDVTMRPAFFWSFGDGSIAITADSGAPYPGETISHTYSNPGTYVVILVTTWGGTWVHNGIARVITGVVRKTSVSIVKIAVAPTLFKR